jgi:hypothetical protein
MEHRWGSRTLVNQTVQVVTAHLTSIARLRDVSASGAFLSTSLNAPYLGRVHVQLTDLHNLRTSKHVLEAQVIRKAPDGIGIEWCDFCPASVAVLIRTCSGEGRRKADVAHAARAVRVAR